MCYHVDAVAAITCKESNSPRGRGLLLHALDHEVLSWEDPKVSEIFYQSFADGLPQEWCAGHYDHDELVIDTRHRLFEKRIIPRAVGDTIDRVKTKGTPYHQFDIAIQKILEEAQGKTFAGCELLIFLGCTARAQFTQSSCSIFHILEKLKISFQLLDPEECCGMILYQLGDFDGAASQAKKMAKRIMETQAKTVITLDAGCYRMFMTRYRRFGAFFPDGFKILHVSEWLNDLIGNGILPFKKQLQRATYHDPCSLARFTRLHEPARNVIRYLFEEFEEMEWNRGKAHCCGGGGGMPFTNPEIAQKAAKRRFEQIKKTCADILLTSCFRCASMLKEGTESPERVQDLTDAFAAALDV